jgi:Major Facilitator Superfamily/Uncharacterized protein conserved in bacteria (DUF2255)
MMPLDLFRSRAVVIANVAGFAFVVGYYGLPFVMSLYLQQVRGLSALGAGAAFVPMMLIGAILTPFSARLAEKLGARLLIITGLVLITAGLVAIATVASAAPVWGLALLMIPTGLGGPLVMPPMTAVLLNSVPGYRAGHGQRDLQHQPPGRRCAVRRGVWCPAGQLGRLRYRAARQPAHRRGGRAGRRSREHPAHLGTGFEQRSNKMSEWTAADLDRIGSETKLEITTRKADGSLRPYVSIWVVRVGDELFVRSWRGQGGA